MRGAIRITTGDDTVNLFRMPGQTQPFAGEIRFLIALPDNPRKRQSLPRRPHRDIAGLPMPFLASTLKTEAGERTPPAVVPSVHVRIATPRRIPSPDEQTARSPSAQHETIYTRC